MFCVVTAIPTIRTSSSSRNSTHAVRRGFIFQDAADDDDEPMDEDLPAPLKSRGSAKGVSGSSTSAATETFVFRVKKPQHKVDVSTASAALLSKKERAQKAEERRQRILKQQREDAEEAKYEKELQDKLTPDQLWLYQIVRGQIKREIRKTNREFANSSARRDIFHLSTLRLPFIIHCM